MWVFEGIVGLLRLLLNGLDKILCLGVWAYRLTLWIVPKEEPKRSTTTRSPKRVVILGASFAGLAVQQVVSAYANKNDVDFEAFELILVDSKEYFEYVPGVLRCFVEPRHFTSALSCDLTSTCRRVGSKFVQGTVISVDPVRNQVILDDKTILTFHFLVIATGSTYRGVSVIKDTTATTHEDRQKQWSAVATDLSKAETVVIVGAGAVGVELAGEIVTRNSISRTDMTWKPNKRVLLVDKQYAILPGFPSSTVAYATKWLQSNGVELHLGAPLQKLDEHSVTLSNGTIVATDVVYRCTGATANTTFLKDGPLDACCDDRGALMVNDHMQVISYPHIFAVGDVMHHAASNELKLGHTAEQNAHLASQNLLRLMTRSTSNKSSKLLCYPDDQVHNHATPFIYAISLGKYDGSLGMNALQIHGFFSAVIKWMLEWTKVAAAQQRPIGIFFWMIADAMSLWLGRTLLPTPFPSKKER